MLIMPNTTDCDDNESITYDTFMESIGKRDQFEIPDDLQLLSTIRYDPTIAKSPRSIDGVSKKHFFLFPEHVERLKFTLSFFLGFSEAKEVYFSEDDLFHELKSALAESQLPIDAPYKVRLLTTLSGSTRIELHSTPARHNLYDGLEDDFDPSLRYDLYVDDTPLLASPYTSFKTTNRAHYSQARERCLPGKSAREEVLLVNTASEVMEGSITNIAIRNKDGVWITPKLTLGCLCGVMRHQLLRKNFIKEGDISRDTLSEGRDVLLMNGIMGCVRGTIRLAA